MMFQNLEDLQCDLPAKAFQRHPYVTLQGLYIQEEGQLTLPAGPITEFSFSFLSEPNWKLVAFQLTLYMVVVAYHNETYVSSRMQRGPSIATDIS